MNALRAEHRYHNTRWYAVQESAALAANATKRDWSMSINMGAIGIAADSPPAYYRNLEVRWTAWWLYTVVG